MGKKEKEKWDLRLEEKNREEAYQRYKLERNRASGHASSQSSSLEERNPSEDANSSIEEKCPSGSADRSLKDSVSHERAEREEDATIRRLTKQLEIKRLQQELDGGETKKREIDEASHD
jgi:hypothetical protein